MADHLISVIFPFLLFSLLLVALEDINGHIGIGFEKLKEMLTMTSILNQKLLTAFLVLKIYFPTQSAILTFQHYLHHIFVDLPESLKQLILKNLLRNLIVIDNSFDEECPEAIGLVFEEK